ncbi:major facilitator superfamily domain-containing protein [Ilyonectria destructans]|nr:major facilitator superfamily domain-containing protein [Ilyonectria destructans]
MLGNTETTSPLAPSMALERTPPREPIQIREPAPGLSTKRTAAVIVCITSITGIGNLLAGLLTVCIPVIAKDLGIAPALQLWPASIFALTCGCTLLPCGAAADVLGCRRTYLLGSLLQAASTFGSGLANTPTQMLALRAMAGIAASFCLPSAVGIVTRTFPVGPRRNIAFAAMGGGQAVGFGLGLTLGGVFDGTLGWRWGFYTTAMLNSVVLWLALWALPGSIDEPLNKTTLARFRDGIDWVGVLILTACLALLSYEFAVITGIGIRQPINIALLSIGLVLLPIFSLWMRRQTRLDQPALIPNSIWANIPFTTVCATVFLVWGALNASEQLTALYLEDVLGVSALTSSLYFLPAPICGALMNVAIGLMLPYLRPSVAVPVACLTSSVAPVLLAALCRVNGPGYWRAVFEAMAINPLGADAIYTIANVVITDAFPEKTQALAGGVFNMIAQIGKSVGIATTAIIAARVSAQAGGDDAKEALLLGYKAGWWYNSAMGLVAVPLTLWGLKRVEKLGVKRE